jgi:hypothetical protein
MAFFNSRSLNRATFLSSFLSCASSFRHAAALILRATCLVLDQFRFGRLGFFAVFGASIMLWNKEVLKQEIGFLDFKKTSKKNYKKNKQFK